MRFYATARGREPLREWLAGLDQSTLRAVSSDLRTVQIGWPLGMPLVRKLEPDLWEIRCSVPAGIVRVLFAIVGAEIVLLHAFVNKSQAIPKDAMDLARKRMKECQRG
jgi:phage-related protein